MADISAATLAASRVKLFIPVAQDAPAPTPAPAPATVPTGGSAAAVTRYSWQTDGGDRAARMEARRTELLNEPGLSASGDESTESAELIAEWLHLTKERNAMIMSKTTGGGFLVNPPRHSLPPDTPTPLPLDRGLLYPTRTTATLTLTSLACCRPHLISGTRG